MRTALFNLPRCVRSLVLALVLFGTALASSASVFLSVNFAPPPLPVYAQPPCPGPGYIWAPGYWAYGPDGYYWVPGMWVIAPFIGALWTPGYWGWSGAVYIWHPGYWGTHVGYYGGIDYGFGYFGAGYVGGYWRDRTFYYNTSVTRVDTTRVHYTYSRPVPNINVSRVSFNGGRGGTTAQPTAQERIAEREAHRSATPMQVEHERSASRDRGSLASVNHGSPRVAATQSASAFEGSELRGRAGTNAPRTAPSHVAGARTEAERSVEAARRGGESGPPTNGHSGAAERERAAPRAAAPRIESRPEMHAQERARPQAAPRMEPRPEARAPSVERPQTAPYQHATRAPEMRAQNVPRPQAAPRMQPAPGREMHAQSMARPQAAPRMQAAPRPEMHAQGQPREGRGGGGRHDEHRG